MNLAVTGFGFGAVVMVNFSRMVMDMVMDFTAMRLVRTVEPFMALGTMHLAAVLERRHGFSRMVVFFVLVHGRLDHGAVLLFVAGLAAMLLMLHVSSAHKSVLLSWPP
ncbi:MAG: hypothetical protein KGL39_06430 [Patescibacteria group bacterium]|nr:hypothetical protein [Patescibacteria group bacterium]